MDEVTIFNNPEFGEVRTLEAEDGKVLSEPIIGDLN